jgi:hypothetical protein
VQKPGPSGKTGTQHGVKRLASQIDNLESEQLGPSAVKGNGKLTHPCHGHVYNSSPAYIYQRVLKCLVVTVWPSATVTWV